MSLVLLCAKDKPMTFSGSSYVRWRLTVPMERRLNLQLELRTVQPRARLMHAVGRVDYSILEVNMFVCSCVCLHHFHDVTACLLQSPQEGAAFCDFFIPFFLHLRSDVVIARRINRSCYLLTCTRCNTSSLVFVVPCELCRTDIMHNHIYCIALQTVVHSVTQC